MRESRDRDETSGVKSVDGVPKTGGGGGASQELVLSLKRKLQESKVHVKEAKLERAAVDKERKIQVALASRFMRRLIRVLVDLKKIKLPKNCKSHQPKLSEIINKVSEIETVDGIPP